MREKGMMTNVGFFSFCGRGIERLCAIQACETCYVKEGLVLISSQNRTLKFKGVMQPTQGPAAVTWLLLYIVTSRANSIGSGKVEHACAEISLLFTFEAESGIFPVFWRGWETTPEGRSVSVTVGYKRRNLQVDVQLVSKKKKKTRDTEKLVPIPDVLFNLVEDFGGWLASETLDWTESTPQHIRRYAVHATSLVCTWSEVMPFCLFLTTGFSF